MATLEFDIPFTIISPYDTLELNTADGQGRIFQVNPKRSVGRRSVRVNTDPVPQGDGEIFHDRYANGYEMQLAVQLWESATQIACDDVLCEMRDQLYGVLWSLLRPADDGGRLTWTPSCSGDRMLDAVRLLSVSDPEEGDEGQIEVTFILDSPFPYAMSLAQTSPTLSGTATLANAGNVEFYPVFKVNGATSAFTITANDTGFQYVYDASRPGAQAIGGGAYAEIDMFRGGLIYLNGDQDNLKPGVDVENSKILTVQAGGSSYTITGASSVVLLNDAYA